MVFLKDKFEYICGTKGELMWETPSCAALGHILIPPRWSCALRGFTLGFFNPKSSTGNSQDAGNVLTGRNGNVLQLPESWSWGGRKAQQRLLSLPGDWAHSGCIWELGGTHRAAVGEYEHIPGPL